MKKILLCLIMLLPVMMVITEKLLPRKKVALTIVSKYEIINTCPTEGFKELNTAGKQYEEKIYCCNFGNGIIKTFSESYMQNNCLDKGGINEGEVDWNDVEKGECGCPGCKIKETYCYGDGKTLETSNYFAYGTETEAINKIKRQRGVIGGKLKVYKLGDLTETQCKAPEYCYGDAPNIEDATYVYYGTKTEARKEIAKKTNRNNFYKYDVSEENCNTPSNPKYCYGDAKSIEDATYVYYGTETEARNEIAKETNGNNFYKYDVSEKNCKIPLPSCYGDAPSIEDAEFVFFGKEKEAKKEIADKAKKKDVIVYKYDIEEDKCNIPLNSRYCYGDTSNITNATYVYYGSEIDAKSYIASKLGKNVNNVIVHKYLGVEEDDCKVLVPFCYGDTPSMNNATYVYYGIESVAKIEIARKMGITTSALKKIYKYSDVSNKNCKVTPPPSPCPPEPKINKALNDDIDFCEVENNEFYYEDDVISCADETSKGYYTIVCNTKNYNSFDLGNDAKYDTSLITLFPGEGFGYKIMTKFVKSCTGTFDADLWNKYYDIAYDNYKNAAIGSEEWYKQKREIEKIKSIAETFNKWETTLNDTPLIELSINTNPKIEVKNFSSNVVSEGKFVKNKLTNKCHVLRDGTTICDFEINNNNYPREIEYIPPKVELDAKTGKTATMTTTRKVDGGNKIYTDLDVDSGIYGIDIKVINAKNMKTVSNNKCSVNIIKKDLLYRIVDVVNPFVNASYKKGDNWVNDNYDYTNVIRKDTWSGNGLYIFDLTKDIISALKEDNSGDVNKYLGTCSLPDNQKREVIKKICNIINSANSTKK